MVVVKLVVAIAISVILIVAISNGYLRGWPLPCFCSSYIGGLYIGGCTGYYIGGWPDNWPGGCTTIVSPLGSAEFSYIVSNSSSSLVISSNNLSIR